jgi:hypothetical protein
VTDPRADLAVQLALEPVAIRIARIRAEYARRDLALLLTRDAPADVVRAYQYRAERAQQDLINAAWRAITPGARHATSRP